MMFEGESTFRVTFSVLILVNVLGNSLVVWIILRTRSLWSPMNFLLVNLAVADLMVGLGMTPVFVLNKTFTHPRGVSGDYLCKFITSGNFTWVGGVCSASSLVLIAFERYFSIMKPTSTKFKITTKKLKVFIPLSWASSVLFNLPMFIVHHFHVGRGHCSQGWPERWMFKVYGFCWLLFAGIIPSCTIAVLSARVTYFLWFSDSRSPSALPAVRRSRKRITKMMLVVSAIFFLCWNTDVLMYNLASFGLIGYRSRAQIAGVALALINSAANPIVYAFQFRAFKAELVKIFSPAGRRVSVGRTGGASIAQDSGRAAEGSVVVLRMSDKAHWRDGSHEGGTD